MQMARAEGPLLLSAVLLLLLATAHAFVSLRPPAGAAPPSTSSPLWRRRAPQAAAGGAADAFSLDDSGWKDVDSSYVPLKQPKLKRGAFRFPRLTELLSATLPPASRLHKLKAAILRRQPVYGSLYHEDYVDACRSLGVPQDIEEAALGKKVEALMVKYEKDRKKKILIDWAHDKILEHRLFLQLDGQALKPKGLDMRLLDERCLEVSQKDALDLMSALDLSPADLKGKPNPVAGLLFNNPLVKALQLKRLVAALAYVKEAFLDSFEGPNLRRLLWPGSVALVLAFWFGNALEALPLKYLIVVAAHAGPIYNRGEAALASRKERRPIKWKKIGLALAFMGISSGASYALGKAWVALKYPTLELPARDFLFLLTNLGAYLMSSSFFIRESTLAGESRRGSGPPGRRPA